MQKHANTNFLEKIKYIIWLTMEVARIILFRKNKSSVEKINRKLHNTYTYSRLIDLKPQFASLDSICAGFVSGLFTWNLSYCKLAL